MRFSQIRQHHRHRFVYLMASLLLVVIAFPFVSNQPVGRWVLNSFATIIIALSIYEVSESKKIFLWSMVLVIFSVIAHGLYMVSPSHFSSVLDSGTSIVFLSFISVNIFRIMLKDRVITTSTIYGAMCVYFLLAIVFGDIYIIINELSPGAFFIETVRSVLTPMVTRFDLFSFSFAMLTTVGQGKLVPNNQLVNSFVIIEQLIGVLFLAVLIARLVTGFSSTHKDSL
jgi:hypothetical protein